jgi:flavin-dependent dehydrogenase
MTILVAEKREGPAPEAAFKVGESSVELSAHYFGQVVGMKDHLEADELPKAGLRFLFPAGDNRDIAARVEWGPAAFPPVPSFQLDRGRFENALAERNAREGTEVRDGCVVEGVEFGADEHTVTMLRGDERSSVTARWVVDASGYPGIIKRKLGLEKAVEHTINAAWFRLAGGLDIEDWSDDAAWHERMVERGIRKFSTNHLMGEGYWVWLIPLASGSVSIGVVADPRFHPFPEINTLEKALEWFQRHEPQLAEALAGRREDVQDFLRVEDFAYSCTRVFSPDRWCLTGIAGVFADPFYSPGSDFIAVGNTYITDLVVRGLSGEDVAESAEAYNTAFLTAFDTLVERNYTNHYAHFGDAEVMTAKIVWDFLVYWSVTSPPFFHGTLTDPHFQEMVAEDAGRILDLSARVQQLFRDWHGLGQREWRNVMITNHTFPGLMRVHENLVTPVDEKTHKRRYARNVTLCEAVAVVFFHKAIERVPGLNVDAETAINPYAVGLDQERWEADGLFKSPGITLNQARMNAAGIENMLVDELAASAEAATRAG